MNKPNVKLLKKWIAALTSRQYRQCQGSLKDSGRYCCLGVLCDVKDKSGWVGSQYVYNGRYDATEAPRPLWDELGIDDYISQTVLIELNDSKNRKFYQIARRLKTILRKIESNKH